MDSLYHVCVNTTPHSSTGYAPHELLFGRKANIPGILQKETPEVRYNYDNYVQELQFRLQSCHEVARANLKISKERSKDYYDRNTNGPLFAIGERYCYTMNELDEVDPLN